MNPLHISLLSCPICGADCTCTEDGRVLKCLGARTHCYDFSKSGYVNLSGPHGGAGDLKAAVRARSTFLDAGYYEPLANEICKILKEHGAATVLDAGCGEGYYTNGMAKDCAVIGADLSVAGIDHAAKTEKREQNNASYIVASLFTLPIKEKSLDAITNLFAPCAEDEFLRVLKDDGIVVLVAAGERHLFGLKQAIYENPYSNLGRADLPQKMELVEKRRLTYEIEITGTQMIEALFSMTPYYWRTSEQDKAKLSALEALKTEVDFDIFLYRKGTP